MKFLTQTIFITFIICKTSIAQNFGNLNFVNYETKAPDELGNIKKSGFIKMWFTGSSSYFQSWELPDKLINKDGSQYSKMDSIKNAEVIAVFQQSYLEKMRTTYLLTEHNTFVVNYYLKEGQPYYFKQAPFKNRFINVVSIADSTKQILGKTCKLIIGDYFTPNSTDTIRLNVWYTDEIKTGCSPLFYIKNLKGLIMQVESDRINLIATDLEMPTKTVGNFNFDIPASGYHTRQEYDEAYKLQVKKN